MRTWKCSECGHTVEISYDWLAENGGPVCTQCDSDMKLLPVVAAVNPLAGNCEGPNTGPSESPRVLDGLRAKVEQLGLDGSDLDDLVHGVADSIAADANNAGLEDQLRYLVEHLGGEGAAKDVDRLARDKAEDSAFP